MARMKWTKVDKSAPSARADFVRQWIFSLFDPEAKQTKGYLNRVDGSACCLGMAAIKAGVQKKLIPGAKGKPRDIFYFGTLDKGVDKGTNNYQVLPQKLQTFLKMDELGGFIDSFVDSNFKKNISGYLHSPSSLADANDKGWSFLRIGKLIRDYPEKLMKALTQKEIEYIKATPVPTRDEYRAKRRLFASSSVEGETKEDENKKVPPGVS